MILFRSEDMGELWFASLENEIQALDGLSNKLRRAVNGYQKDMGSNKSHIIEKALAMFWELCDQHSQRIVFSCNDPEKMKSLRKTLADHANHAFNAYCPNDSAKQMNAWAKNIPDLYHYISNQVQEVKIAK